ncbi:MAG: membrane protein insertion efficiency factor YidD [Desulfitobacteriaceae bacterium]|nr:membrane protein insertion efficiency factor YidD [Desulfitobacteriaceae bacterium]MDD4345343.1 membrane protein insertion efficiency factor YidD [Desulfitobacteriaceae bacterium]MDD4400334.1 membrane protein insertion efficiency factor YidD [Desulfitobacteriaceae bacterium]
MIKGIIILIRLYQKYISPLKKPSCRFFPTCSEYMVQALIKYGFFKGIGKSIIRIMKCQPFHPGGHDPI